MAVRNLSHLISLLALRGEIIFTLDQAKAHPLTQAASTFFREVGPRKKLFDMVNAARKTAHAELATMPLEHMGLPASFADQFFRHDSGRNNGEAPPTLESVEAQMADLERQLAEKAELHAELQAEADRAATEEAERAATQAAIAELEKAAAEAEQKAAEARAKIAALSR